MKEKEVIVYSKPNCGTCAFVKKYLQDKGIPFIEKNIAHDEEARDFVSTSGFRQMPIVSIDGELSSGYDAEILDKI